MAGPGRAQSGSARPRLAKLVVRDDDQFVAIRKRDKFFLIDNDRASGLDGQHSGLRPPWPAECRVLSWGRRTACPVAAWPLSPR